MVVPSLACFFVSALIDRVRGACARRSDAGVDLRRLQRACSCTLLAVSLAAGLFSANAAQAMIIVQWNFNGPLTGTRTPSIGSGTAIPIGVTFTGFGSGSVAGGSSDPETGNPPNYGWQISGFPAQGTASGSAGIEARVDTRGWRSIQIGFDLRASTGSPRHQQLQYALDGRTFIDFGVPYVAGNGDQWVNQRLFDLDAIAGAGDNPLFAFRLVSVFAPGGSMYLPSVSTSAYSQQGSWRFDMLTVSGEPLTTSTAVVPLPASGALLAGGLLALSAASLCRRRARRCDRADRRGDRGH